YSIRLIPSMSSLERQIDMSSLRIKPASSICNTPPIIIPLARPNTSLPFTAFTPCNINLVPKHMLKANEIIRLLQHYPDPQFPQMLARIAMYGARLGYEGTLYAKIQLKNHKSALLQPSVLDEGIS